MGHFRKNEQSKSVVFQEKNTWSDFEQKKKRKTETVRFWGISGKIAYAVTCEISPPQTFWGISRHPPLFNSDLLKRQINLNSKKKSKKLWILWTKIYHVWCKWTLWQTTFVYLTSVTLSKCLAVLVVVWVWGS